MAEASPFVTRMLGLSLDERRKVLSSLEPQQLHKLLRSWSTWARPEQIWRPRDGVSWYVYTAGRGWGKNAVGVNAMHYIAQHPWLCGATRFRSGATRGGWIGIAGRTANDVNNTIVNGANGIMAWAPDGAVPAHHKADKILEWPNGVIARLFSGDEPASFRGPNVGALWADEVPYWKRRAESFKAARGMLRVGQHPPGIVTMTPRGDHETLSLVFELGEDGRPIPASADDPRDRVVQGYRVAPRTHVTTGHTRANAANLADSYLDDMIATHGGTESEGTELGGEVPIESPDAAIRWHWFRTESKVPEPTVYRALMIDPAGSDTGSEVGMLIYAVGVSGRLYFLRDESRRMTPSEWSHRAVGLARQWSVDRLVFETNYGEQLGPTILRDTFRGSPGHIPRIVTVRASTSKWERLLSVRHHWELGHVIEIVDDDDDRHFAKLDLQLATFDPKRSSRDQPNGTDRMDVAVWAAIEALGTAAERRRIARLNDATAWGKVVEGFEHPDEDP